MLLCDAPQIRPAEGEVDYIDLLARAGVASGLMGKINCHYLLHEDRCPGEVGEVCTCGLVVAFVGPAHLVLVDGHYRCWAGPIN